MILSPIMRSWQAEQENGIRDIISLCQIHNRNTENYPCCDFATNYRIGILLAQCSLKQL